MSGKTAISWTDYSSNPIKYRDNETGRNVWACVKKSAGCANCYAEALALRWGNGRQFSRPNIAQVTPFLDEKEMARLLSPKAIPSGSKVFVGDMTDVFGSWVPDESLDRLFGVMALRPDVTFQLLTKRPERMAAYLTADTGEFGYGARSRIWWGARHYAELILHRNAYDALPIGKPGMGPEGIYLRDWPLPNVWLGTSVENQEAADARIPHLLQAPAAVRFLSCEPLLGSVDLMNVNYSAYLREFMRQAAGDKGAASVGDEAVLDVLHGTWDDGWDAGSDGKRLDWVIVGGESGPKHRPMDLDWLASLVRQCQSAGVPVWVKQDSGQHPGRQGRIPDALYVQQFPTVGVPSA